MKVIVVFATLVAITLCDPGSSSEEDRFVNEKFIIVETANGVYEIEDVEELIVDHRPASESDLSYSFYNVDNIFSPENVTAGTVPSQNSLDPSKKTFFIIHDWRNSHNSPVNTLIKEALLPQYDVNVVVVDWSPIAKMNYVSAYNDVVAVGTILASFIRSLESSHGLNLALVTLVGHSLGAHIAGNTGAALGGDVGIIIGLDPPEPLFTDSEANEMLSSTDARFVQVIHSSSGALGSSEPMGHADYYPNGGWPQPGCGLDITEACSHGRAYRYYAESLGATCPGFAAVMCNNYIEYVAGICGSNLSYMGGYEIDTGASGIYYLSTNEEPPYAQALA